MKRKMNPVPVRIFGKGRTTETHAGRYLQSEDDRREQIRRMLEPDRPKGEASRFLSARADRLHLVDQGRVGLLT